MELLIVISIIIVVTAMSLTMLSGFLKGSQCKQAGRIIQGQFFKARQLASSKRTYHYLRIATTSAERLSSIRIFEDTDQNHKFCPPEAPSLLNEDAVGALDNPVGETVFLPRGCYIGCDGANGSNPQNPVGAPAADQTNCPAGGLQVIDYQFMPDGQCYRIGVPFRDRTLASGSTNYAGYTSASTDIIAVQEDGQARLLIDINPMAGKIQKMIFQTADPALAPNFYN